MSKKSPLSNPFSLLFTVAGVVLLALACYNYLQGGGVGGAFAVGILCILIGLFFGGLGKRRGA